MTHDVFEFVGVHAHVHEEVGEGVTQVLKAQFGTAYASGQDVPGVEQGGELPARRRGEQPRHALSSRKRGDEPQGLRIEGNEPDAAGKGVARGESAAGHVEIVPAGAENFGLGGAGEQQQMNGLRARPEGIAFQQMNEHDSLFGGEGTRRRGRRSRRADNASARRG